MMKIGIKISKSHVPTGKSYGPGERLLVLVLNNANAEDLNQNLQIPF